PVSQFWVKNGGKYLGIDTDVTAIEECRRTYRSLKNCEFYLTQDPNAFYKKPGETGTSTDSVDWPVQNATQNALVANSVFTHLQEPDARKYMKKIYDVLAPGGIAVLTFHVVRDFVNPDPTFNFKHRLTPGWYTSRPDCPEIAIAMDLEKIHELIS